MDKAQMLQEQEALLKKYAKELLLDEVLLLAPEIADLVLGLLPDSVKQYVVPFEAEGIQKLQDVLKQLIESKLG